MVTQSAKLLPLTWLVESDPQILLLLPDTDRPLMLVSVLDEPDTTLLLDPTTAFSASAS